MKALWRPCLLGCIVQFFVFSKISAAFLPNTNRSATCMAISTSFNKHIALAKVNPRYLRLQLIKDAVNTDDIIIKFDSTANAKYNADEDAKYLQGFGEEHLFSYSADSVPLAINVLPLPKQQPDIIRLNVSAKTSGAYQLYMKEINNIPKIYDVWLVDRYNTDSLDMRRNTTYSFNLDKNDSTSYGANRFALVIRENPTYAYRLITFDASKAANSRQVQLTWTTANEENSTYFTVQRSDDNGTSYKVLYEIQSAGLGAYSIADENPGGQNVYRLKQRALNDSITYSKSIAVTFAGQNIVQNTLNIYPNPVNDMINLSVGSPGSGNTTYDIKFMNSSGLVIKEVTSSQPSWEGDISGLLPGVYFAQVHNHKTTTLVGRKRFVKY